MKIEQRKRALVASSKKYRDRLRSAALAFLGGKCVKCGFSDERALQIDHINGGGRKEFLEIHAHGIHKKILETPGSLSEYQLLCANCNWIKRVENHEGRG